MNVRGKASLLALASALAFSFATTDRAHAAVSGSNDDDPSAQATVTVYGADWCGACHALEQGLRDKQIPFEIVDVEKNPSAYAYAKKSAGAGNSIPLTGVSRKVDTQWIVGADVPAVEKAYKGE